MAADSKSIGAVAMKIFGKTVALLLLLSVIAGFSNFAAAQEPSALQAALVLEQALVHSIAAAEKSVVAIARVRKGAHFAEGKGPTDPDFVPNEFGTGVIVDRAGLILTNYHVLGDIAKHDYYVWVQKRPFQAKATVEAADPWIDLAVLKIEADDLQPMKLGNAKGIRKGQLVIVLGNPYAIARDGQVSASWGIISNTARKAVALPRAYQASDGRETLHHYGTLIQVDAKLNMGTSGGALINLQGEMIGLTTSLAALAGYDKSGGFAIPVNDAFRRTLEKLKTGHKADFGFLGVEPQHLTTVERQHGKFGARIKAVVPGTPAMAAKLQSGDIITQVDGERVFDKNSLIRLLSQLPAQTQAVLTIQRGGRSLKTKVVLTKKFIASARKSYSRIVEKAWRGIRIDYATAIPPRQFQQRSHQIDPQGCVAVVEIQRDSPAWKAGLRLWTFISHVGSTQVSNPREFYEAVAGIPGAVQLRTTNAQRNEKPVLTVLP